MIIPEVVPNEVFDVFLFVDSAVPVESVLFF